MPLYLNPNVNLDYVLKSDLEIEKEKQPTFHLKILTDARYTEFQKLLKVFKKQSDNEENPSALADIVFYAMSSWKNMGNNEYSKESIREILTVTELAELFREILRLNEITSAEKKE